MENKAITKQYEYITLLHVISMIAVVFLHVNECYHTFNATAGYWPSAILIECVFYYAVPIFFMLTGATLMDYSDRYDTVTFYKRRAKKVLFPYLFWSIAAVLIFSAFGRNYVFSWGGVIDNLLNGSQLNYWFFIPLFSIYLILPVFSSVPKEKRKRLFSFFVFLHFIVNILLPFLNRTVLPFPVQNNRDLVDFGNQYIIYVLAGYLLHNCDFSAWQRRGMYVLAVIGLFMRICGTYTLSMQAGKLIETYGGYMNIPSILYATGVFVFVKNLAPYICNERFLRFVHWLKQYTFPVYLLHMLTLRTLKRVFPVDVTQMWWRLGAPSVIIGICIAITWCVRKIRPLRVILPQ